MVAPLLCHLDSEWCDQWDLYGLTVIFINIRIIIIVIAPPVFDYARTYVIFEEFSKEALEIYTEKVLPDMWDTGVSAKDFEDALEVSRIIRNREKNQ